MNELLEFLRTHEAAFRSRARLASLYSDFRYQRSANPDGYEANASTWLRALASAVRAEVIPSQSNDRLVLHTGDELASALQTPEFGRPLALGAVLGDAVKRKELLPMREFLDAQQSIYARSWALSPWQIVNWGLQQLGVVGGATMDDGLVKADLVVMANVEDAAKTVLDHASRKAISNCSRVFSNQLFSKTFAPALGLQNFSSNDLSVLLKHLARDRSAISYSPATGVIKFKAPDEAQPSPINEEDISISSLRTLISSLEVQVEQLMSQVSKLEQTAREAVSAKRVTAAKSALRSKKLADTKLQQRTATLTQLEDVYAKIEQASDQVELVRVMQASSQTLRNLNRQTGGVEKVQDVREALREDMMDADEIGQALNEVSAGDVDEGEVEDELEALEKVEREKREEAERKEKEIKEAAEEKEKERKVEEEAEQTRKRLAALDDLGEQPGELPSASDKEEQQAVAETNTDQEAPVG